ncbi:unnamed protein product [Boreogadus saida]
MSFEVFCLMPLDMRVTPKQRNPFRQLITPTTFNTAPTPPPRISSVLVHHSGGMEPRTLTPYHSVLPNITQTPDSIKDHHRLLPAPDPLRRPLLLNAQSKSNISLHKMTGLLPDWVMEKHDCDNQWFSKVACG